MANRQSRMPRSAADMRRSTSRARDIRPTSSSNNTTQASSSGGSSSNTTQLPKPGNNWDNYSFDGNLSKKEIGQLTSKWSSDPQKSQPQYWITKANNKNVGVNNAVYDFYGIDRPTNPGPGNTNQTNGDDINANNFWTNVPTAIDAIIAQYKDQFSKDEQLNAPIESTGLAPSGSGVSSMATSWRSRKGRRASAGRGAQGVNSMTIRPTNNTSGVGLNI